MTNAAHSQVKAPRTYFDAKIGAQAAIVLPGDHMVIGEPKVALVTLLGSCVAACIRDIDTGVGGLNHFLLPDEGDAASGSLRYGTNAMEVLINDILKHGGRRDRLEAKVFGGGNVIDTAAKETVGDRNAKFVIEYLQREGVKVAASDLGGTRARRVFYFPTTGRASVLRLAPTDANSVRDAEMELKAKVAVQPKAGGVELF